MTSDRRAEALETDLEALLKRAAVLASRGRSAFDADDAMALAFEAICNRVGDIAKKLMAADPGRYSSALWSSAARNRDFVVHQYHRIDLDVLWNTVTESLPRLSEEIKRS